MQLNESTYETIFLLYIDNELSPKERLEVEAFIAANSSYALEMEVLKATLLRPENIQFAFKENLKQQEVETSLEDLGEDWEEDLDKDWNVAYSSILKDDMQAITGLSTSFKNTLKKETVSKGKILTPFRFNQNKFTYAAIAACLMIFVGYQQLTKSQLSDSSASNSIATNSNALLVPTISKGSDETIVNNSTQLARNKIFTKTKKEILSQEKLNTSEIVMTKFNQKESIAIAEPTRNNSSLNNQVLITKLPSTYNNPMTIDAMSLPINTAEVEATSYEVIDTEDPNRTIFIANFEIDGNKFRGLKRKISSLFKNTNRLDINNK